MLKINEYNARRTQGLTYFKSFSMNILKRSLGELKQLRVFAV